MPVSVLMARKSSVHAYSADWNKMATCDFGPVAVKCCETVPIFTHIWIISWDADR